MQMPDSENRKYRICMIVQQRDVKGGIAAVTSGYYGSALEERFDIRYVESYCDGSKVKKLIKAIKGYLEYAKVLREFKPDLVHIHSSFGPSFYRMQPFLNMAVRKGIPVIDHNHGADFESFYEKADDNKKSVIEKVYNRFAKVVVLSDEWKKRFSKFLPAEKLTVIENYTVIKDEEEVQRSIDKRYKNRIVLFLGELGKRKGGYDFGKIVKAISKIDPDVKFVFCGEGSPKDKSEIINGIKNLCPDKFEDVSFPGWVRGEEKKEFLNRSTVFILPSYQEGLPMSVLEAMGYGLPVISTNVGGIPQLLDNESGCYTCEPGDADAMAEAYKKIIMDENTYIDHSLKSYETVKDKYSFESHISKLSDLYLSVIETQN